MRWGEIGCENYIYWCWLYALSFRLSSSYNNTLYPTPVLFDSHYNCHTEPFGLKLKHQHHYHPKQPTQTTSLSKLNQNALHSSSPSLFPHFNTCTLTIFRPFSPSLSSPPSSLPRYPFLLPPPQSPPAPPSPPNSIITKATNPHPNAALMFSQETSPLVFASIS